MTKSVAILGDILIDELLDDAGSLSVPGGSALNVAVGLTILGVPTTLVGMIGDDENGEIVRAYLAGHGVDFIPTISPDGTGRAVSDRRDGEPRYRFNRAMRNRHIDFSAEVTAVLRDADLIAVSGYPFDSAEQADRLVEVLQGATGLVALDPNPRHDLIRDLETYRDNMERVAALGYLLKLGGEDAALLYGASAQEVADRLLASKPMIVLGTTGANGAFVRGPQLAVARPIAADSRQIVDTMGAGDAVFAVILSAISRGAPTSVHEWQVVLDEAMSVASETVRYPGALLRLRQS